MSCGVIAPRVHVKSVQKCWQHSKLSQAKWGNQHEARRRAQLLEMRRDAFMSTRRKCASEAAASATNSTTNNRSSFYPKFRPSLQHRFIGALSLGPYPLEIPVVDNMHTMSTRVQQLSSPAVTAVSLKAELNYERNISVKSTAVSSPPVVVQFTRAAQPEKFNSQADPSKSAGLV